MMRSIGGGLPPRFPPQGPNSRLQGRSGRASRDYTPLSWKDYFDTCEDIEIPEINSTFRVYLSGFQDEHIEGQPAFKSEYKPLLVLLHGGGYSGLSWATFVKSLEKLVYVKVAAIDIRGHGCTKTDHDDDLSIETLSRDIELVCQKLITEEETRVILMGHSMGGAIAVHTSHLCESLAGYLSGLVVVDVVEGTAIEALQGMQSFLRGRPKDFSSLENAIEWSVRSGQTKNLESARVSMPSQLTPVEGSQDNTIQSSPSPDIPHNTGINIIQEDEEDEQQPSRSNVHNQSAIKEEKHINSSNKSSESNSTRYKFRVDLTKSEIYWRGWFEGLSHQFLSSASPAKLLLLAGIDRLDRSLTVGQMQGKFQMQVLPECGHAVHEDVPDKVSPTLDIFSNVFQQGSNEFPDLFPFIANV